MAHRYATDASFKRRLKRKTREDQAAVMRTIERLVRDPTARHTKLLQSGASERIYYSRISGGNRLTWHWEGKTMVFRNTCKKSDVLRGP